MAAAHPPEVAVVAVDGGNSKTEVALVDSRGTVLGVGAGGSGSHQTGGGVDAAIGVLRGAITTAEVDAGIAPGSGAGADLAVLCLAGIDLPIDERMMGRALIAARLARRIVLRNDAFAGLRAGARAGWGVSVVFGAGINCVGVGPNGRHVRFAALGDISGDIGGGGQLGLDGFGATIRARDGRGPRTILERTIPAYFGCSSPAKALEAVYTGRIPERRLVELAPIVLAAASADDAVARAIVDRSADEVVTMASAAIRRLHLTRRPVEVVLAGSVFRTDDQGFLERIRSGIAAVAPQAILERLEAPPVLGAALLGADALGLGPAAERRIRAGITFDRLAAARKVPAGPV